jgi:threonylcarbamoyladenosine tRNA methylthiotransferase MtaB
MKFTILTLGCRLNQAESDQMKNGMAASGFIFTDEIKEAEIGLINTCSVTHKADRRSRNLARSVKRMNPGIYLVVCGCSKIKLPEVDFLAPNKNNIVQIITNKFKYKIKSINEDFSKISDIKSRVRANIKIQEGCDNFCTYCIVPYLRGMPRSVLIKDIINEISAKELNGCQEVVLSGINIGKYYCQNKNLADLIKVILAKTNIPRVRLSSINPEDISDEFLKIFKNERICNHLHLSLQSGSDTVLKRMGRKYTIKKYTEIVKKLMNIDDNFGITTDLIVGFPHESNAEFNQTCDVINNINFLKVHLFQYSKRKGTKAAKMPNQIDSSIKRKRAKILLDIADKSKKYFLKNNIELERSVLFENKKRGEYYFGYTENYIRIKKKGKANLTNTIKKFKIKENNIVY